LSILLKFFEMSVWDSVYCLLKVIKKYGKEQTRRLKNWQKGFDG